LNVSNIGGLGRLTLYTEKAINELGERLKWKKEKNKF
jgi:hypothetical protein